MIVHEAMSQLSPEWFAIRKGKMTASHATAVGNCGKGLETYTQQIAQEYFSGGKKKHFSNHHTERGNDLEASACDVYSFEQKIPIQKVGFCEYNEFVGCSPDRFAGEDGLAECKCFDDKGHFALIMGGDFESGYKWQCQMQMLICGKNYDDLFSYNPNYDISLIVHRQYPDPKKFEKLRQGFAKGEAMLKSLMLRYAAKIREQKEK